MLKTGFKEWTLYEDQEVLIINKPAGISTLEDRAEEINIFSIVKKEIPGVQVCHRLDKDTSGVLIFAKGREIYRHISMQFQERNVNKIYHTIVHGQTDFSDFEVNVPLIVKSQGIVKWDKSLGKDSRTVFNTLQNFKNFSLLECRPVTGRRHQIRVHLKSAKHPILGDTVYGGEMVYLSLLKRNFKRKQGEEKPIINRMALHAASISFERSNGERLQIEAPYPKDFSILIKQLSKYNSLSNSGSLR